MQRSLRYSHSLWKSRLEQQSHALDALSPLKVLARGYASCVTGAKDPLLSVGQLEEGDPFSVQLSDGDIEASVTGKRPVSRSGREHAGDGA
jgi:exodeoxyribonuclease VII large subunit